MKIHTTILVMSLVLLLIPHSLTYGENPTEYAIQVESDGTALWIITQTRTDVQPPPPDPLGQLESKVASLVEAAKNKTQREMTAEIVSYASTRVGSYYLDQYRFYWRNFSRLENTDMIISDVFQVKGLFLQLYGDGQLEITYPGKYNVQTASPKPSEHNDSIHLLRWPGTTDFDQEGARIVFTERSASSGLVDILGQNALFISSLALLVTGSSVGIYMFRRRKKKQTQGSGTPQLPIASLLESDEEKVMKLLKSFGGSLRQSEITDQCKFSRAKTSQLLSILEKEGIVTRYKKGRDKVVVLVDEKKSEEK